jgi:predicted nicotinamide N-methyase
MADPEAIAFITTQTTLTAPALIPELRLHLATEVTPLWQATEATLAANNLPPPYWAFAWPGGQAVARYVLDHPHLVAGRRVLDFAAGSGVAALVALRAGAASVTASEIDRFAIAVLTLNAAANALDIKITDDDLVDQPLPDIDVILAGDICYERPMAERVTHWLRQRASAGTLVLLGDPGRAYLPKTGLERLAQYDVPTSLDLEDRDMRQTNVWRLLGT